MTVAVYVRVSTEEQAQHGYSIDDQKEKLIAYCNSQGWDDYKLYIDDGYSGTNMNRPAIKRLIRHVEEGSVNTVLVYKLDRLSRKQKDVLHLLEDVFDKNNAAFKSATEPFDTSTSLGKAIIGMLAVFAQLERDMIVERTTAGRRQRVSQGSWYGGPVPFGYFWDKESQELHIVPDEARLVREIFNQYAKGNSRLSIAEWVSKRTKVRYFDHAVIRDMLARPIYMGKLINNGAIVDGKHKAIVDEDTWYSVQKEVGKRKEGLPSIGEYLLTGLLVCGVCGCGIVHVKRVTHRKGKKYEYDLYACKNQHVRAKDKNNHCKLGYFQRSKIENYVIDHIKIASVNPEFVTNYLEKQKTNSTPSETEKDALLGKLKAINEGLDNLYDAIQTGIIKASNVSERIKKLEEDREAVETQLEDIKDNSTETDAEQFNLIIRHIGKNWDYLTLDERKSLIRKVIQKVTLDKGDDHDITWNI